MPTFFYDGKNITIDTLYSYARVSSSQQTIEEGGEGIPRQLERFEQFAHEFNIPMDGLTGQQFIDSGLSGSKGDHLKKGAALAAFMEMAKSGKLGPNPGLAVESFSRLGRMPTARFNTLFWAIMESRVTLVTLKDRRAYNQESVNRDKGQPYQIQAMMQAAASYAEDLADYSTRSWRVRRGQLTAGTPAWFDKYADDKPVLHFKGQPKGAVLEVRVNPAKYDTLQRVFTDILTIGVDRLTRQLNREGVPSLAGRGKPWNQANLAGLIRDRMVLGEQRVGKYIDGKKTLTGEVIKDAYPAVVTEEHWLLANAALDGRKKGAVVNGRNASRLGNLFGPLAVCDQCNGRMKIVQKGRVSSFKYFACSNARLGKCDVKGYHRLDRVEARLMKAIEVHALDGWDVKPVEDQAAPVKAELAHARAKAEQISQAYEKAIMRPGALAEKLALKLEADHEAKNLQIKVLERKLAAVLAVRPMEELVADVMPHISKLRTLKGDDLISARTHVAQFVRSYLRQVKFRPDGTFIATRTNGIRLPIDFDDERPVGWIEDEDPDSHLITAEVAG